MLPLALRLADKIPKNVVFMFLGVVSPRGRIEYNYVDSISSWCANITYAKTPTPGAQQK